MWKEAVYSQGTCFVHRARVSVRVVTKQYIYVQVYAKSESGKEIRKIVQQLNMARGTADEEYEVFQAERADEEMTDDYSSIDHFVTPAQSKWAQFVQTDNAKERVVDEELPYDDNDAMFVTSEPDWQGRRGRKRTRRTENVTDDEDGRGRERRAKRNSIEDGTPSEIDRLRAICQPSMWQKDDPASAQNSRRSGRPPSYPRHQRRNAMATPRRVSAPRERHQDQYCEIMDNGFVTTTGGDEVFEEEVM